MFCFLAAQKENTEPYFSVSDFVADIDSGVPDYVGAFACSAGFGVDELCREYAKDSDDFHSILCKALADRLAEALAEHLHRKVRTTIWAYSPDVKKKGKKWRRCLFVY